MFIPNKSILDEEAGRLAWDIDAVNILDGGIAMYSCALLHRQTH